MQIARRLYLYAMSGITLAVIASGLMLFLDVIITGSGVLEHPSDAYVNRRQQLSQAIAMLGVGVPVWAFHWWFVQRGLRPGRAGRDAERGSAIRATYLTLVLLISLVAWVSGAAGLLQWFMASVIGSVPDYSFRDPVTSTTSAIVGLLVWLYHGVVHRGDLGAGPVLGAAAWLPRLYRYGVSLGALVAALGSLESLVTSLVAAPPSGEGYSRTSAIQSGVTLVAWGLVWVGHWRYSTRLVRTDDARGADERVSRTRLAAFIATIVVGAGFAISGIVGAVQEIVAPVIGRLPYESDVSGWSWLGPAVSASGWAIVWWAHLRRLRGEPAAADPLRVLHQVRLASHGMAAVGLAFGATGLGWILGLGIDVVFGGIRTTDPNRLPWTFELAGWLPMAGVGLGLWAWQWSGVLARRRRDPDGEANSTIRRAFLFLTLAVALVSALGGATLILYRLVGAAVGASLTGNAVSELSTPIGAFIMAAIVLAYHGLQLRSDQAIRPIVSAGPTTAAPTPVVDASARVRRTLELVGPEGADLDAALAAARAALPDEIELVARE